MSTVFMLVRLLRVSTVYIFSKHIYQCYSLHQNQINMFNENEQDRFIITSVRFYFLGMLHMSIVFTV